MSDATMNSEYADANQRYAVCMRQSSAKAKESNFACPHYTVDESLLNKCSASPDGVFQENCSESCPILSKESKRKEPKMLREYIHESVEIPVAEVTAEMLANGVIPVRIMRPGFNSSKSRNYTKEAVQSSVTLFEGAKMYANHATKSEEKERPERDIRDWVSTLKNIHISKVTGESLGEAHVHSGWFKEMGQGLLQAGTLNKLGVSINTLGRGSRRKVDGVDTFVVESFIDHPFKSVDFVTEPGAGGQAGVTESVQGVDAYLMDLVQLREARPDLVKEVEAEIENKNKPEVAKKMELQETIDKLTADNAVLIKEKIELAAKIEEAAKAKARTEAQTVITAAIGKSTLPDAAKERLSEHFKEAENAGGIDVAIKVEADYLAKLTESGKVKGLGVSTSDLSKLTPRQKIEAALK
jgi:hypothetical protein